jgi:hypothetical protein
MREQLAFVLTVSALVLAGLGMALLRHVNTELPFAPGQERSVWLVEARVDFRAGNEPITVSLSIPERLRHFELGDEQSAAPGYGFALVEEGGDRRIEWTRRSASGPQSLYYLAQFVPRERPREPLRATRRAVESAPGGTPEASAVPRPTPVFWDEAEATAAAQLLFRAQQTSSSPRSLARELARLLAADSGEQNAALLRNQSSTAAGLLQRLLNDAGVPARQVLALELEDARRRQSLLPMVELFEDGEWHLIDPGSGQLSDRENLLLWHRQGRSLLDVRGGSNSAVSFSMIRQSVPATLLSRTANTDSLFYRVGVHSLPIEEQSMFKMLLLLPLGAAVVVFMRVLVGVQTAGTFMPVLIALAFLQTSLLPGLISFVSVVALGLLMRTYLSRLNLLLVARIATLIVLVIFIIAALSIIGYQLGYSTGMVITFFPMIIIAWTIERMSILWEEEGGREVLVQGSGSLLVAVAAWYLMQLPLVKHLSFNFPELSLVLLGLILAVGRYTGYKLSELRRFRSVADDRS